MTEKEVHQLIEEQAPEHKKYIYEQIREEAERSVIEGAKARQKRKRLSVRLCTAAAIILVAVCLAVVLPIVLTSENNSINRYSSADVIFSPADWTLKEYSQQNGAKTLYIDWYDGKNETLKGCETTNRDNIVYITEHLVDTKSGCQVLIYFMADNIIIEGFELYETDMDEITLHNNVLVKYKLNFDGTRVMFKYGGYKYYLNFVVNYTDINFILETVESMFEH